MRASQLDIQYAQRNALERLIAAQVPDGNGNMVDNSFRVQAKNVTIPAFLIQEQQLTTAGNIYTFDFSASAPQPSTTLGNVVLGKNQIAVAYGFQILLGEGASANTRVYRTYGPLVADDVVYKGTMTMKFESSEFVENISTGSFYDRDTVYGGVNGLMLINPARIVTGQAGKNQVILTLPALNALTFTSNLFISVRAHIALGKYSA